MNSKFFNLNWKDLGKGLIVAVLTAIITYLYQAVKNGGLETVSIDALISISLTSLLAYMLKQLSTNSKGQLGKKE